MMTPIRTRLTLIAALAVLALGGCSLASEPIPVGPIETGPLPGEIVTPDVPVSLPSASQGQIIYLARCVSCHGDSGAGDGDLAAQIIEQGGQAPNLADPALARSRSPQDWYRIITDGNMAGLMPPWGEALTDAERWNVTYFLYSFSQPGDVIDQGQALYEEVFAQAYGPQGEGIGLDLAALAEASPQTLYDSFVSGSDSDLSEGEGWAVVAYMQTFGYERLVPGEVVQPPDTGEETGEATEEPGEEGPGGETGGEEEPGSQPEVIADSGLVRGAVVNLSPGGTVPADLQVSLRGLSMDTAGQIVEFMALSAAVAEDGTFAFEDVPFDVERSGYVVEVIYNGVTFNNGQLVDPTVPVLELPIEIYESTTDSSVVRADAVHFIIVEHPDALLVTQVAVFSNLSDRIYVTEQPVSGGQRGSVAVATPADAYSLQFEDGQIGGRFIPSSDRIYDTSPLYPGEQTHSIILTYFLPFDRAREIELPVFYDTRQVTLLVQDGPRLRSDQLTGAGVQTIDNVAYNQFVGQELKAGDTLAFRLAPASAVGNLLPTILVAVAGVLIVGGATLWAIQRRSQMPAWTDAGELSPRQQGLVNEIASLDGAFEAGRVNRFEYEARRAELRASLAEELEDGGEAAG